MLLYKECQKKDDRIYNEITAGFDITIALNPICIKPLVVDCKSFSALTLAPGIIHIPRFKIELRINLILLHWNQFKNALQVVVEVI